MKLRRFTALFFALALTLLSCVTPAFAVEDITIDATAVLLLDGESETVLFEKNAHERRYPASTTKIMTALLVVEAINRGELRLEQPITASLNAVSSLPDDASTAGIDPGETLTAEQLLYCLLVVSANEVGNIFAEELCGSVPAFVEKMNARAAALGCEDTHFVNTSGLPDNNHYTTAWDLWLMTREAMKHDLFMTVCNTKAYSIPDDPATADIDESHELHSTNLLISNWRALGYLYSGAQGIKTGTTDAAGHCLVSTAVRADRRLVSVVLGCDEMPDPINGGKVAMSFTETARLFDWGFENFSTRTVLTADEMICEVPVLLSQQTSQVVVHPAEDTTAVLPNDLAIEDLERIITLDQEVVNAPIMAGDRLGQITLRYGDTDYATVPLLAMSDVAASRFLIMKTALITFFSHRLVHLGLVLLAVVVILILLFGRRLMQRRRYGSGRNRRRRHRSYRGRRF
ncbi:MAG: D-alanyl-D-alanine carboxypeptidase [Oscillospiraceae bacterium]|nr:D-alanyl-D-alanine carboxypeptidase [Oscillospiraceae bacterium]